MKKGLRVDAASTFAQTAPRAGETAGRASEAQRASPSTGLAKESPMSKTMTASAFAAASTAA